jgi:hypothetical protein
MLGVVAAIAVLTVLRFRPWERATDGAGPTTVNDGNPNKTRQELTVGFLPVT